MKNKPTRNICDVHLFFIGNNFNKFTFIKKNNILLMSFFIIDVEADSKSPLSGSMVCFGAVRVTEGLNDTFYGQTRPINDNFIPEALSISGFSREEHLKFDDPIVVMRDFADWVNKVNSGGRPIFISDNNGFDWMWICSYFDLAQVNNPFGYSSRRIGDIFSGIQMDASQSSKWKKYRKTKHDHNPVSDAKGNAEALLIIKKLGLKICLD